MSPDFLNVASNDPGLAPQERTQLLDWLRKPEVAKQLSGAAGAAIGIAVAKYAKLGRTSQVLLGVAGYSAGRLLYDYLAHKQQHRQFATYNDRLKAYEMDSSRY